MTDHSTRPAFTRMAGGNVHANGIRQHYLRFGGAGPAVILAPGITSPAATWSFVAERLGSEFDVFVLDIRGRGLSESGPHLDYGLDACADDLVGFAAAMGLESALAMGHSMGARHLVRAAARGARFSRYVLVDPPVSGPGRRPYPTPLDWYIEALALARKGADAEALRPFTPTWTDDQLAVRAEWLHTCDERAVAASFKGFHEDDIHPDFVSLRAPSLLVTAERGDVVRDGEVQELLSLAPGLVCARVPDAGHMIPWDNLDGFDAAVRPFLTA
jgi:N-formylmaleamate deformylase